MSYEISSEFYTRRMSENALKYYNELKKLSQKGCNFVHIKTPIELNSRDKYNIKNALKAEGYHQVSFDFGWTVIGYLYNGSLTEHGM